MCLLRIEVYYLSPFLYILEVLNTTWCCTCTFLSLDSTFSSSGIVMLYNKFLFGSDCHCDVVSVLVQCSLAAGRLTSGLSSITIIVCGGAVIQAIAFSLLLLKHRCISAGSTRSFLSNDLQSNIANLLATYFVPLICLQPLSIPCSMTSGVLQVIYPLLIAGFLGIGDGVLNTQISALLGILFKHNLVLLSPFNLLLAHDLS